MGKKIPLLISTLTIGLASLGTFTGEQVFATEVDGAKTYWTVLEMAEFEKIADQESEAVCGDDYRCREEWRYEQAESNPQYWALMSFKHYRFIVSSLNPSQETMKLYYKDTDEMHAIMTGEVSHENLDRVYLSWIESWIGDASKDASWLYFNSKYPTHLSDQGDIVAATHILLDETQEEQGKGWFTPNVEREYSIAGSDIANDQNRKLYFTWHDEGYGTSNGIIDYLPCFDSPDYHEGMECKFVFNSEGGTEFVPAEVPSTTEPVKEDEASESNESAEPNESTAHNESTKLSDSANGKSTTNTVARQLSDNMVSEVAVAVNSTDTHKNEQNKAEPDHSKASSTKEDKAQQGSDQSASNSPVVPLSGESNLSCASDFPWWFIALVAACDVVIMWFFWPKNRQKTKK